MKIRDGFVSNSSSSSFIVAVPKDVELTDDLVREALGIKPGTHADMLFSGIIGTIASAKKVSTRDILDEYGHDDLETASADGVRAAELMLKGWNVHSFFASDESGDPDEMFLCFSTIELTTEKIIIEGGGGY